MMAARRSRTGCATCRKRKLKCDEAKPVCGQCTKSRRECVPSDGVAFRHEQNAGLNSESQEGERSLGNFFKYRNNYTPEQMKNFIQTPPTLEWRYITDVYADDTEQMSPRHRSSPQAWQRALEALSAAAAENQAYQPPVTYADISNLLGAGNGGYGPAGSSMQGPNQNNNIKFLLNPSSTPAAMIDPNLDTTALESIREATEDHIDESPKSKHDSDDKAGEIPQNVTNEEQVAFLLKNYDEQAA